MTPNKKCLLIIDDEPNVCDSVHDLLRREFRVLKATSAAEGFRNGGGALAFARDRLPESRHFAECGVIFGAMRARSVHKACYGHNCDGASA